MPNFAAKYRSTISTIVVSVALVWVAFTLWRSIDQLPASLDAVNFSSVALASMPAMASVVLAASVYALVLSEMHPIRFPLYKVALLYGIAQVVRYLPGKVWGALYIAQAVTQWMPAVFAIRANLVQFALLAVHALAAAFCIYVYYREGVVFAVLMYAFLWSILSLILAYGWLQRAAAAITRDNTFERTTPVNRFLLLALLQVEWLTHVLATKLLLPHSYSLGDSVIIAALYGAACLVGSLSLVLPGGLVARESSFLWIGGLLGYHMADLLVFSVVSRVVYTVGDVACAVMGVVLTRPVPAMRVEK